MKKFDLNIESILENWELHHAIREIIANALDEQFLTGSRDIEIFKRGDSWVIRDFGRGIQYLHLTQNENQEKLSNPNVIGKFGIGLKDALATFHRRNVAVNIKSKHNKIRIIDAPKQEFQDIVTLHAVIDDAIDLDFVGSEFELSGINDLDVDNAKKLFLKFSGEKIVETTKQGQIVRKIETFGNIYINGVKIAEEDNFLFSYNITTITAAIKKSLNRERTNVGRSAYTDSIKRILLSSIEMEVAEILADDLTNISNGDAHDELSWIDVQEHAVKILNQEEKYLFVTSNDAVRYPDMLDQAKINGHEVIFIPDNLSRKIEITQDLRGNRILSLGNFIADYNESFEFNFIKIDELNEAEKEIYLHTTKIIEIFGGKPQSVFDIKISSTMRAESAEAETMGCWDRKSNSIVISRKSLKCISDYAGTLIHELVHAKTGNYDVTRLFETDLTNVIGNICAKLLCKNPSSRLSFSPSLEKLIDGNRTR